MYETQQPLNVPISLSFSYTEVRLPEFQLLPTAHRFHHLLLASTNSNIPPSKRHISLICVVDQLGTMLVHDIPERSVVALDVHATHHGAYFVRLPPSGAVLSSSAVPLQIVHSLHLAFLCPFLPFLLCPLSVDFVSLHGQKPQFHKAI